MTRLAKNYKVTHNQKKKKNQSIHPKITKTIQLTDKEVKIVIITMFKHIKNIRIIQTETEDTNIKGIYIYVYIYKKIRLKTLNLQKKISVKLKQSWYKLFKLKYNKKKN